MNNHIDVSSVCLYSNLVTRPTGAAVRHGIEHQLDQIGDKALAVLDFSHVGLLDFSCADEIVAKLLQQYIGVDRPRREVYFVFYGMSEIHLDAIEAVLERHGLALVAVERSGDASLVGKVDGEQRRAWETVYRLGRAVPSELASETGMEPERAREALDALWRRRLVLREDMGYVALRNKPPEA